MSLYRVNKESLNSTDFFFFFYTRDAEDPRDAKIQKISPEHDSSHWDQTPREIERRVIQLRETLIENIV